MTSDSDIYHEKQSRQLCALHSLNNLFQRQGTFKKKDLDDICNNLSPNSSFFNPHRSIMGLGNYDVNVMMAALQLKDCEAIWFDKRRDIASLNLAKVKGFILNIPTDLDLGFMHINIMRKHWITVTKVRGAYYNLDSKLSSPKCIGEEQELREFLKSQISSADKELFVVVDHVVGTDNVWLHPANNEVKVNTTEMGQANDTGSNT